MITGWLLDLLAGAWAWLCESVPAPSQDGWVADIPGAVTYIADLVGGLGAWVPLPLIVGIIGTLGIVWGSASGLKLGRMVLSLFTGGGGSAAS